MIYQDYDVLKHRPGFLYIDHDYNRDIYTVQGDELIRVYQAVRHVALRHPAGRFLPFPLKKIPDYAEV